MITGPYIHVAIADDHTLMRTALVGLLESSGDIVVDIEAGNGIELLKNLEQAAQVPDICILDISMPFMDGPTALKEIKKRWPQIRCLILTGLQSEIFVIGLVKAGANGFLLKKCSEDELLVAIRSIHAEGYYYSEYANSKLFELVNKNKIKLLPFTEQEIEFLKFNCSESTFDDIAPKMNISLRAVWSCRDRLFQKLNVSSRIELAMVAVQLGLTPIEVNVPAKSFIAQLKTKKK